MNISLIIIYFIQLTIFLYYSTILPLTVLKDKIPFKPFVLAALEGISISF